MEEKDIITRNTEGLLADVRSIVEKELQNAYQGVNAVMVKTSFRTSALIVSIAFSVLGSTSGQYGVNRGQHFVENALILEPTERQKGIKTCYLLEIGYSYKPLIIWSLGTKKISDFSETFIVDQPGLEPGTSRL